MHEYFNLLRYHLGRYKGWGNFTDFQQHSWVKSDNSVENKFVVTANLLLAGKFNMAALYYSYVLFDDNTHDNEDGLGALGFKVVF